MPAFNLSFDSAYDIGAAPALIGTGVATAGLAISVVSPLVFDSSYGYVRWSAQVSIGAVDMSARLTGNLKISAGEDSARVASLSVIPRSVVEMQGYDGQIAVIDVTLFRTAQTATYRLFTGPVERVDFDPNTRVAEIACRDGWQERPKACTSAVEVEGLFEGQAKPSEYVLPWSDTEPDPTAYFSGLLDTLLGSTAIDANGLWRVIPWTIGTAAATFAAGEVFDGSISYGSAARADLPTSVNASLALRYSRLHAVDVAARWDAVERYRYVVDGLPPCPKSTVVSAVDGLSEWYAKGKLTITEPAPGSWPVIVGGATVYYVLSPEIARTLCNSLRATLYRRWYQQVEAVYSVEIPMSGLSGRVETITTSISSTFDSGEWESAPISDQAQSLYSDNPPPAPPEPPTGYEGMPPPYPVNGAIDYLPDVTLSKLTDAAENIAAQAVRKAAQGRRQRTVRFARPLDPRWELGAVLAINAAGVSAKGQVAELEHELDIDRGTVASTFTLAVPDGSGTTTASSATIALPTSTVSHSFSERVLGNWVGASWDTPATPDEDALVGFLCNVDSRSDNYDPSAPAYEPQFRIIMPEIPATWRDPATVPLTLDVVFSIAAGDLSLTF